MCEQTDQSEKLEEVEIGVEFFFNGLKTLGGEDTHGIAHGVQASTARENEKTLEESLTAGDVLQPEIRNSVCKLRKGEKDVFVTINALFTIRINKERAH